MVFLFSLYRKKKETVVSREKYENIKKIYLDTKKSYLDLESKYKHEVHTNNQLKDILSKKDMELEYLHHKLNELYEKYKDLSKDYDKLEKRTNFLLSELEIKESENSKKPTK
ncbi:conserved hypothetical protein [Methanococcus vannielii SB]|uniref:Uncharacterized protein n=1 Tax=Methanococcus vannielii (strain ATCC 35089 / DSM 1224 / JCM 13029 / OCM 148 / SB) TaxID=406327 RepID=A6UPB7_METVS|nr:conserved hypothetical protein [Methanococcus vannielii SB]